MTGAAASVAFTGMSPVTTGAFRDAMSRLAAGVTIVTTAGLDGDRCGFTATSFASVSMAPPLVSVCLARTARSFAAFTSGAPYAVNLLHTGQAGLARRFAQPRPDKFDGQPFVRGAAGAPVLTDALAVLECTPHSRVEAGDHVVLLGRVDAVRLGHGDPLVYCERTFGGFDA